MLGYLKQSLLLMGVAVTVCCGIYPLTLWVIGQTFFPEQANGSLVHGRDGSVIGSRLIAQPFTKDEYFQPRPSAPSYDASASAPSNLSASNYVLRNRVANALSPIVKYRRGAKAGQLVGADIEAWFQQDQYQGNPHIVAQWANAHGALAQAWVKADASHAAYVDAWAQTHQADVAQWIKDNPATPEPVATDLAVLFFSDFSTQHPGQFPGAVEHAVDGKTETAIEPVNAGTDIQATFFDMWRHDHADDLQAVPADMVMTSGSGLDPHITLDNAIYQLDRVADAWAKDINRDPADLRREIRGLLDEQAIAPGNGLFGPKLVNVLEMNMYLQARYGAPPA